MDSESQKNFREYATRVSFNMSLSRNQIAVLHSVRVEQSMPLRVEFFDHGPQETAYAAGRRTYHEILGVQKNLWVPGVKPLIAMGLITWHDPGEMKPKWSEHVYRMTEAGDIVCQLLEIAGLIPKLLAANQNVKKLRGRKKAS